MENNKKVVDDKLIDKLIKKQNALMSKTYKDNINEIQLINKLIYNINDLDLLRFCFTDISLNKSDLFKDEYIWINVFFIKQYNLDLLTLNDFCFFKHHIFLYIDNYQYVKTKYVKNKEFNCYICYLICFDKENKLIAESFFSTKSEEMAKHITTIYDFVFTNKNFKKFLKENNKTNKNKPLNKLNLLEYATSVVGYALNFIDKNNYYLNKFKDFDLSKIENGIISMKDFQLSHNRSMIFDSISEKFSIGKNLISNDFEFSIIIKSLFVKLHRFFIIFCRRAVSEKNIIELENFYQTSYEIQKGEDIFDIGYFNYFGYKFFEKEIFTPDQLFLLSLKKLFKVSKNVFLTTKIIEDKEFECYCIKILYLESVDEKNRVIKSINAFYHHDINLINLISLKLKYLLDYGVFKKYKELENKTYQELLLNKSASKFANEFYQTIKHLVNPIDFINILKYDITKKCYIDHYQIEYKKLNKKSKIKKS